MPKVKVTVEYAGDKEVYVGDLFAGVVSTRETDGLHNQSLVIGRGSPLEIKLMANAFKEHIDECQAENKDKLKRKLAKDLMELFSDADEEKPKAAGDDVDEKMNKLVAAIFERLDPFAEKK